MAVCQGCARENSEGFRFCGLCTAPLDQVAAPVARERKAISVLFCDLTGFRQVGATAYLHRGTALVTASA
jgi:hypothetical protein